MAGLHDMAKMSVSGTPGTGTITLGFAVSGYQTFAAAGVVDGEVVSYSILDGTNWEVGRGTYTASGETLSRGPLFSNVNNAAINASSSAVVWIAPLAEDFRIAALQDTSISFPADGQVLQYTASAGKWQNVSLPNVAPQGRLTLSSGTPVLAAGVTGATTVYYTPYTGNAVPVPVSAGVFKPIAFSEVSLPLDATTTDSGYQSSGKLYDVFLYNNSGTLVIGTGPAWSSASSRGSGSGTTQIQPVGGLWVNANAMTLRLGAGSSNTATIGAQMALYLGTIYATANGQTAVGIKPAAASGGNNTIIGLWNAYNRVPIVATSQDSTSSWTYQSATWRSANNSNSNRISWVDGLGQTPVNAAYFATYNPTASSYANVGVSFNSAGGPRVFASYDPDISANNGQFSPDSLPPTLGFNYAQAVEWANTPAATTFFGGPSMQLSLRGEY